MTPEQNVTRAKADSGLIDLFAIDRDARAEQVREAQARSEVPPPVLRDIGPGASDDVDEFAAKMQNPWKNVSRVKLGVGIGGVVLVLIAAITLGGRSEPPKTAALASPPPPVSQPAAPEPSIPPPSPVVATAPSVATVAKAAPAATPAKGTKARKSNAPAKARHKGPKLEKIQSGGV